MGRTELLDEGRVAGQPPVSGKFLIDLRQAPVVAGRSVVVPRLEEVDLLAAHEVHDTVLLGETP